MTTFGHLFDGFLSLFNRQHVPDKLEPSQRVADIAPRRRELTPKRALRIQKLKEVRDRAAKETR